jgi:signal transduction histidine kinase
MGTASSGILNAQGDSRDEGRRTAGVTVDDSANGYTGEQGCRPMSLAGTLGAVALDGTAVALLGWTTWTAFQSRNRPSGKTFVAVLALMTAWAVLALGAELAAAVAGHNLTSALELALLGVGLVVPGVWTMYVLGYAGRGTGLTRRRALMLAGTVFPVVLGGAIAIVSALQFPDSIGRPVVGVLFASLAAAVLYLFALFVYAAYVLVRLGWRHTRISNLQIAVLLLAASAPYLGGAAGTSASAADGVTVGLLTSGVLFTVAIRRYPVMTGFPRSEAVARTRVVEALQEAVVVLDWDGSVLDANETTARLFDRLSDAIVGEPVESVVDGIEGTDLSAGATGTVALRTTKGRRQFQYSVSAVDSTGNNDEAHGDPVARAVVFRDVTDRQTREQRLTVLNRVLRHNVRNELDVVLAHADRVEDETLRAGIRDSATDLVDLSEKAREAEEVMQASTEVPERIDLVTIARDVAEQYRTAVPERKITLSCPDEVKISSHESVVRKLLSELVDNAVKHTDGSSPRVGISVRSRGEATAEVAVADDGPGIPEREREILTDGTETSLEHGRGVGLWTVKWAVTQLGGELAFEANDPEGSVVTVRLHDAEYASDDRREPVKADASE